MFRRGLPTLALLTACSSGTVELGAPGEPTTTSGSRLRAQSVAAVEGRATRLLQVFDRQTGEPCWLGAPAPGSPARCTPSAYGMIVHRDAACTTPHVETPIRAHPWISAYEANELRFVRAGARVAAPGPLWFLGATRCIPYAPQPGAEVFEIAETMPEPALVHGPLEQVDVDERLAAMRFTGDDGSRFLIDLVDRTSGAPCAPALTAAGPRCRPDHGPIADQGLMDARCERLAILEYGAIAVAEVEGHGVMRFEVAPRDAQVATRGPDGTCGAPRVVEQGRKTLHFGVPYPAEAWPPLTAETAGGPRVTTLAATGPRGADADALRRSDRSALLEDQGTACGPVWVDGVLRCLPPEPSITRRDVFADPACTRGAVAVIGDVLARGAVIAVHDDQEGPARGGLPAGHAFEVIGDAAPDAYEKRGDGCAPLPLPLQQVVPVGPALPAARFAELELLTD